MDNQPDSKVLEINDIARHDRQSMLARRGGNHRSFI